MSSSSSGEKRKRVVGSSSVGDPPMRLTGEIETLEYKIYKFADREEGGGEYVEIPPLLAHGHEWALWVYPRGDNSSEASEHVGVYLYYTGSDEEGPTATFTIRCKKLECPLTNLYSFSKTKRTWGFNDFLKRDDVLKNYLDEDGTLVIEVDIQIATKGSNVWYPKTNIPIDMLARLYNSPNTAADVVFDVGGVEFLAHKNILSLRAKTLFELTTDGGNNSIIANGEEESGMLVPIRDMEAETFEQVLEFIYCVRIPEIKTEDTARKLLLAADRLDCTDLKLYAESTIVDKFLKISNAADWLVASDAHSCALLKEASMKLHASDASAVMKSPGWSKVAESNRLLIELFEFSATKNRCVSNKKGELKDAKEVDALDVTSLRERLSEASLEVDGSREILVERLKNYVSNNCSNNSSISSVSPGRRSPQLQRQRRRWRRRR